MPADISPIDGEQEENWGFTGQKTSRQLVLCEVGGSEEIAVVNIEALLRS